jgi:hypothetical protein
MNSLRIESRDFRRQSWIDYFDSFTKIFYFLFFAGASCAGQWNSAYFCSVVSFESFRAGSQNSSTRTVVKERAFSFGLPDLCSIVIVATSTTTQTKLNNSKRAFVFILSGRDAAQNITKAVLSYCSHNCNSPFSIGRAGKQTSHFLYRRGPVKIRTSSTFRRRLG